MPIQTDQLRILNYPEPVLRARAQPIEGVDEQVRQVAHRMLELMHAAQGVGLAGPQVGLPWRLFVANTTGEPEDDRVFINPVLSQPSRETEAYEEGCLSLPHITGQITRPTAITIDALDEHGKPFTLIGQGLDARCWQHEYDHLEGILIIDRMPPADRMANRRALRELER